MKKLPKKKVRGKALHTKPEPQQKAAAPARAQSSSAQSPKAAAPKAPAAKGATSGGAASKAAATKTAASARPKASASSASPTREASPSQARTGGAQRPGDRVVDAQFAAGATSPDQFPPPALVEIAFAGRSNVGKSSLLNRLMERRSLVRTSSTPGCTRQISWFEATCDDKAKLTLVDLPGYGYARRSKTERAQWGDLIDRFLLERPTLRGVAVLTDIRRGLEADDLELLEMLAAPARVSRPPLEVILVATKLDKLSTSAQKVRLAELSRQAKVKVFGFSAPTGTGRLELWRKVRRIAGLDAPPASAT